MESGRSQPVLIENALSEFLIDQCSFDDNCAEWQDLEQFWGEEKQRLQELDGPGKQRSSSLEEHLLNDEFLNEPLKDDLNESEDFESKVVRGQDIADIPTTYVTKGFRPQELIVIGTYVDEGITPGFQYVVRKNLTEEYLFEGKAKALESIGLGYGKRITFEGDTLNENENYFWSDSRVHGYGFTHQTFNTDDTFDIFHTKTGQTIGRVLINKPSSRDDLVLTTTVGEHGYMEKEVEVHFTCDVVLSDSSNGQNLYIENLPIDGKAIVVRESLSSKAKVNQIFMDEFIIDSCFLISEE